MGDFLNPKSMLTPGVAGALMMFLANAVCATFPEATFRYVALGLSFTMGLVVFQATAIRLAEKAAYWLLNSLIIFSTGVGASNIAANIEQPPQHASRAGVPAAVGAIVDWMITDSVAQPAAPAPASSTASKAAANPRATTTEQRRNGAAPARTGDDARNGQARRPQGERQAAEVRREGESSGSSPFFRRW